MKLKMALPLIIYMGVILGTNNVDAQLYEYKKLDGLNSEKPINAAKGNNDQQRTPKEDKGGITVTPNPPTTVPFDGGITLVLAAGAGLALKKRYGKKSVVAKANNTI